VSEIRLGGGVSPPIRPVLRYHGGKWRLAPWIIGFFPPHRLYTEAYGGAASVLMRKPRCYAEVYNDLDGEIVNLFRVLRSRAEELVRMVELTPFSRADFHESFEPAVDELERARRTLVRSFMGFGGNLTRPNRDQSPQRTGFRTYSQKERGSIPAQDWRNYPAALAAIIDRLRGVIVESRPAQEVIEIHDAPDALHYVDPPYVHSTRGFDAGGTHRAYRHEMNDEDHAALAKLLREVKGMVAVSGYPCPLYDDELYPDWERFERGHLADGARPRTEVLWLNAACSAALERSRAQPSLLT
jgi:DNA adenine methylase